MKLRKKERKKERKGTDKEKKTGQFTFSRIDQSKKHQTGFKANNTITEKDPIYQTFTGEKNRQML